MKRFYKAVSTKKSDAGYQIFLDNRLVKTPGGVALVVPTSALAAAVVAEWEAQEKEIVPASMPVTKLANTVIDRVTPRFEEVAQEVAAFGGTDLLCYRADEPITLVVKQAQTWDPYLTWAESHFGAKLTITTGIMPVIQPEAALARLRSAVTACNPYELTVLHDLVNGFGSLILGLSCLQRHQPFEAIWAASLIDQTYQQEQWGEDWEAKEKQENTLRDLQAAMQFLALIQDAG